MTLSMLRILDWSKLDAATRRATLRRPAQAHREELASTVRAIIDEVRARGDAALFDYTAQFDQVKLDDLLVREDEIAAAASTLTANQRAAIERAIETVGTFHAAQRQPPLRVETAPGVVCERLEIPLSAVGLYVPAGTAPLPSAAIMIGVPARLAGCEVRAVCTPPRRDGRADPAIVYAANACGATHIFKVGGAQAIAALAYGTASIPKCDKLYGPGNAYVTAAKLIVGTDPEGAAYDLPAGPSEVLVIADDSARPAFVASDLLAQAEHGADAQVVLVTTSRKLAEAVIVELGKQTDRLGRGELVRHSLEHARLILVDSLATACDVANAYAPEHLLIEVEQPRQWLPRIRTAGSVFLGAWTPESMGDYCSGTNHVLPTYGFARSFSGLSLQDFMRRMTVQELTPAGIQGLGPVAQTLAMLEGLDAHANAVTLRLEALAAAGK